MGKSDNFKQNSKKTINIIYLFLVVLSAIFFSSAKAEVVNEIIINGNQKISDETVIIYGDIKKNSDYNDKDLNIILKNLYETNFFENVSIDLKNNKLTINLKEYKTINLLTISGEKSNRYQKEIKKILKLREKSPFIKSFLANDISLIKKLYSSLGYNFVNVETKIKEVDNNRVDLIIEIERGPQSKISSIKFIGDKKVRDKRLRDVIVSEEDKFWKILSKNSKFNQNLLDLDIRLLKNYYKSIGYYEVKVDSQTADIDDKGNVEIIYSITAGNRYIISKISTNPDPVFKKDIFQSLNKNYQKVIGEYYSPFTVKKLLEDIDDLIENNNLQFVEHNVQEIITANGIEIIFNIFEGERTLVERINIFGNNITDESVIRGELLLDEGDPFTDLSLEKSISKIKARNIFGKVDSKVEEGSEKSLRIINIDVEERPTGEISAGAGIGTDGGTIAFNISENNWLGEGKRVNFGLELDNESVSGTIDYTNPNYDFLGKSLNYFLKSTSNDKPDQGFENTVVSAGIGTSFEQYKDIFVNLGLASTFDDLRTDGSASDSLKKQSGEFTEISANYGFRYDKRNRAFMPTSGSVVGFNQSIPFLCRQTLYWQHTLYKFI